MTQNIKEELKILDIECKEDEVLSIRSVNLKFKKLAKVRHPDKPGGTKEDFQMLLNAYRRVIKHLEEVHLEGNDIEVNDDHYEKEFFMRCNFPKENKTGFTVILQNDLSAEWREIFVKAYGDSQNLPSGGMMFKKNQITFTLYIKPKSDKKTKVHVQSGSQEANFDFVFNEMPLLFKQVLVLKDGKLSITVPGEKAKSVTDSPELPVAKRLKNCQKFACDECDYTTSKKILLKGHIEKKHIRTSKRTASFTPMVKTPKRAKTIDADSSIFDVTSCYIADDSCSD